MCVRERARAIVPFRRRQRQLFHLFSHAFINYSVGRRRRRRRSRDYCGIRIMKNVFTKFVYRLLPLHFKLCLLGKRVGSEYVCLPATIYLANPNWTRNDNGISVQFGQCEDEAKTYSTKSARVCAPHFIPYCHLLLVSVLSVLHKEFGRNATVKWDGPRPSWVAKTRSPCIVRSTRMLHFCRYTLPGTLFVDDEPVIISPEFVNNVRFQLSDVVIELSELVAAARNRNIAIRNGSIQFIRDIGHTRTEPDNNACIPHRCDESAQSLLSISIFQKIQR